MATMVIELQDWHKTNLDFETLKSFERNISAFINWKYYILISNYSSFLYKKCCFIKVEYFELYNHTVLKPAVIKSPLSSSVVWSTRFSHWPQWWHKEVQVDFYSYITL